MDAHSLSRLQPEAALQRSEWVERRFRLAGKRTGTAFRDHLRIVQRRLKTLRTLRTAKNPRLGWVRMVPGHKCMKATVVAYLHIVRGLSPQIGVGVGDQFHGLIRGIG